MALVTDQDWLKLIEAQERLTDMRWQLRERHTHAGYLVCPCCAGELPASRDVAEWEGDAFIPAEDPIAPRRGFCGRCDLILCADGGIVHETPGCRFCQQPLEVDYVEADDKHAYCNAYCATWGHPDQAEACPSALAMQLNLF